jgi:metal-responsive CopG/Arc/MetJ family transcriptional regulator
MKRTSLFLPEVMLAELAAIAKKRGTPMAELVRAAVERFLKEQRDGAG